MMETMDDDDGDDDIVAYPSPTTRPGPPSAAAREVELERARRAECVDTVDIDVLYVDDDVIVVNKPAGVYVEVIERRVRSTPENETSTMSHRLDRDTSGCLVFARTARARSSISVQFRDGVVKKAYLALCAMDLDDDDDGAHGAHRAAVEEERVIESGHGRAKYGLWRLYDAKDINRVLPGKGNKVKHALTTIAVESVFENATLDSKLSRAALVRCAPKTGRTHQIRLHCASVGLPLIGDVRYGGPLRAQITSDAPLDVPGVLLHASEVTFFHPRGDGSTLRVVAPAPSWGTSNQNFATRLERVD